MAQAPYSAADRQRLLAAFERSGLTQEQFCAGLRATGNVLGGLSLNLRPRTLRAWARAAREKMPGVDAEEVRKAIGLLQQAAQVLEAALADHHSDLVELQPAAASEQVAAIRDGDAPSPTVRPQVPRDYGSPTAGAAATRVTPRFSFAEEWERQNTMGA